MHKSRYIITGGPGSGKSTLLEALAEQGFCCYQEVSRKLIREQALLPEGVLPWNNLPAFAKIAIDAMTCQHTDALGHGRVSFFDRGIPDIFGYLEAGGHPVSSQYVEIHSMCSYHTIVFVLPPWEGIFINDSERPQSFEESVELYWSLRRVYERLGYVLYEVPKTSVVNRVKYLLAVIGYS